MPGVTSQGVEHLGAAGPLTDLNAYGERPTGTFFNRVQTFEADSYPDTQTIHFPKSCSALRGPTLRCLSRLYRCQLQAQERRHRAGGLRQVHRLQILQLGLPLRRPVSSTRNAR